MTIDKNSFLGRTIVNAYNALTEAKYHIDCTPPFDGSTCNTIVGKIEIAESQLATVVETLIKK